jgi:SAM-dependent methyltransferase
MTDLKNRTIGDFGEQWTAFRDNPDYYGSTEMLADIFGPLLSLDEIRGKAVADIGSGTGRIVDMLLTAGARRVVAVEPSAAMRVLKENTASRADKISISTTSCRWECCITFQSPLPSCAPLSIRCAPGDAVSSGSMATKATKPTWRLRCRCGSSPCCCLTGRWSLSHMFSKPL